MAVAAVVSCPGQVVHLTRTGDNSSGVLSTVLFLILSLVPYHVRSLVLYMVLLLALSLVLSLVLLVVLSLVLSLSFSQSSRSLQMVMSPDLMIQRESVFRTSWLMSRTHRTVSLQ